MLPWLSSPHPSFPSTEQALESPNGLLAAGGELTPAWLVDAYRKGIFPWYSDKDPILWWSPDPRMILLPAQFKRRRSLAKRLRHGGFSVTLDQQFIQVVEACAAPRKNEPGTWINPDMRRAYQRLHELGIATALRYTVTASWSAGCMGWPWGQCSLVSRCFHANPTLPKLRWPTWQAPCNAMVVNSSTAKCTRRI